MLTVTQPAATLIVGLVTAADLPRHGGLRIGRNRHWNSLHLSLAAGPAPHESVLIEHDASVFIDRGVVSRVQHHVLDAIHEPHCSAFFLRKPELRQHDALAGLLGLLWAGIGRTSR
ncbi:MAG: hypothetical protein Q8R60_08860 [Mycobacteriales bacterium]|nr:hypothetical protein [Mycobacteriales bacterium]